MDYIVWIIPYITLFGCWLISELRHIKERNMWEREVEWYKSIADERLREMEKMQKQCKNNETK